MQPEGAQLRQAVYVHVHLYYCSFVHIMVDALTCTQPKNSLYTPLLTAVIACRRAVNNTCKMLMALGIGKRDVYEDDFEKPFLRESREFFKVLVAVLS